MEVKILLCLSLALHYCLSCRIHDLQYFEDKIFSQNGEDGVLLSLLDIVGMTSEPFYVEFGVGDGSECNTRVLRERLGFTGLSMDSGYESESINLKKEFVTERNIIELFLKYDVPAVFDVLSVDLDMFDWWVLLKILIADYRPRVIIVETNPSLCVEQRGKHAFIKDYSEKNMEPLVIVHPNMTDQESWDGSRWAGANPAAFRALAEKFEYEMVYAERCGVNAFFVQKSALPQNCIGQNFPVFTPYPCFGTTATRGAYPGHIVDPAGRQVLRMSDTLLDKVTSKMKSFSMDDITSHSYSCSSRSKGWGDDWCSYLYPFPSRLSVDNCNNDTNICKLSNDVEGLFNLGYSAFRNGSFNEAVSFFTTATTSPRFPVCRASHRSESACVLSSAAHYNLGISYLRAHFWTEALGEFELALKAEPTIERVSSVVSAMMSLSAPTPEGYSMSSYSFKSSDVAGQVFQVGLNLHACEDIQVHVDSLVSKHNIDIEDAGAPNIYLMQVIRCCYR